MINTDRMAATAARQVVVSWNSLIPIIQRTRLQTIPMRGKIGIPRMEMGIQLRRKPISTRGVALYATVLTVSPQSFPLVWKPIMSAKITPRPVRVTPNWMSRDAMPRTMRPHTNVMMNRKMNAAKPSVTETAPISGPARTTSRMPEIAIPTITSNQRMAKRIPRMQRKYLSASLTLSSFASLNVSTGFMRVPLIVLAIVTRLASCYQ